MKNKDSIREKNRIYYNNNKVARRASCKKWIENNREKYNASNRKNQRKNKLKVKFGLVGEVADEILEKKNGFCMICGKKETHKNHSGIQSLSVDHNHITGKFRGLLCNHCNVALGHFLVDNGEGVDLLCSAISYLRNNDELYKD